MRGRRRVAAVAVAFVAVACADNGEIAVTSVPVESSVSTTPAVSSTVPTGVVTSTSPAAAGEWVVSTVPMVTEGIATQSDQPIQTPDVHAIGHTSFGWFVVGSVNGGFTVWRSADLSSFEPVHAEVCCERSVRVSAIAEFDGSVLIGGTENRPDGSRAAFLWRSDDAGATWSPIEAPLFTSEASRVDRIVAIGDTVLVEAVDDRDPSTTPRPLPAWSADLVTWTPVVFPGASPADWATFTHDDQVVYAVVSRQAADGSSSSWAIWRSDDGGRSFSEAPALDGTTRGGFVVAGGSLVALPQVIQAEYLHGDAVGPAVLAPGGEWTEMPPDTGTWGDGFVSFAWPGTAAAASGSYVLMSRESRASVHYCYEDPQTCGVAETALLVSADGLAWAEIADVPELATIARIGPGAIHAGPDGIDLVAVSGQDSIVHVVRWTGAEPPPAVERPDYPPPDIPIPLYEGGRDVEIGEELRYPLGLGGCGGLYTGDQRWEPEVPLPDPPPPEWPSRTIEVFDAPGTYVYGAILRTATDTIEFSIEGVGTVATFHPAPAPETFCG